MRPITLPSKRLGTLPGLRWLVDSRWAPLTPALVGLVMPFLVGLALEWRMINPFNQYLGVMPGDVFLSIAGGIAVFLAGYHLKQFYPRWYQRGWWHAASLTFGVLYAAVIFYGDVQNSIHQYWPEAAYTFPQIFGPTHLYHSVIVVLFGYLWWTVVLPVLIYVPRWWWAKLLILLLIAGWVFCFAYLDNHLPRPDLAQVHGEWFGGHWRALGLHIHPLFDISR